MRPASTFFDIQLSNSRVPPYIIFSDKTLVHMCILKPATKGQMLEVSGVGEYKYEKYGEQFLDIIADWKRENVK